MPAAPAMQRKAVGLTVMAVLIVGALLIVETRRLRRLSLLAGGLLAAVMNDGSRSTCGCRSPCCRSAGRRRRGRRPAADAGVARGAGSADKAAPRGGRNGCGSRVPNGAFPALLIGCWPNSSSPSSSKDSSRVIVVRAGKMRIVLPELLLRGGDQAEIMLGVLIVVFRRHRIARRVRVARELDVFFGDMRRRSANLDVGTVQFVTPATSGFWFLR